MLSRSTQGPVYPSAGPDQDSPNQLQPSKSEQSRAQLAYRLTTKKSTFLFHLLALQKSVVWVASVVII